MELNYMNNKGLFLSLSPTLRRRHECMAAALKSKFTGGFRLWFFFSHAATFFHSLVGAVVVIVDYYESGDGY
jgi:hypothetical protein